MKLTLFLLPLSLPAMLMVLAPLPAAPISSFLIVPGHSIGQTKLGLNGDKALTIAPTASDASMGGKVDAVWRARNGTDTLYIHTRRNDIDDPPRPGDTVTEIRVTSPRFHTKSGLAPGSTLAEIRHRFPGGRVWTDPGGFYMVAPEGIAFEFVRAPRPDSRCLAVTIFPPCRDKDAPGPAGAAQVKDLLGEGR